MNVYTYLIFALIIGSGVFLFVVAPVEIYFKYKTMSSCMKSVKDEHTCHQRTYPNGSMFELPK